jgi:hypothetical protein
MRLLADEGFDSASPARCGPPDMTWRGFLPASGLDDLEVIAATLCTCAIAGSAPLTTRRFWLGPGRRAHPDLRGHRLRHPADAYGRKLAVGDPVSLRHRSSAGPAGREPGPRSKSRCGAAASYVFEEARIRIRPLVRFRSAAKNDATTAVAGKRPAAAARRQTPSPAGQHRAKLLQWLTTGHGET